jgi:dolichol-phosphate mannosyltransferase
MIISVVIPAHNEEGNIGKTIDAFSSRLSAENIPYEFIIIDDACTDNTVQEVSLRIEKDPKIRLISNTGKHGFGYAVRYGLEHVTGDAVAIVMADLSDDPNDLVKCYYIVRDEADCAFGSRFMKGSTLIDYPIHKLFVNRLANFFISTLFGFRYNDTTNAFKVYRTSVIQACRPFFSPHFNLTVEIPLKAIVRGYSYKVVSISWYNRNQGKSKFIIKEMGSRYLFTVLNIWLEKVLTRNDYIRPNEDKFSPWQKPTHVINNNDDI